MEYIDGHRAVHYGTVRCMCAYVYVCMYACVYSCMYAFIFVCNFNIITINHHIVNHI